MIKLFSEMVILFYNVSFTFLIHSSGLDMESYCCFHWQSLMANDADCLQGYVGYLYIFFRLCEILVLGFLMILLSHVDLCLSSDQRKNFSVCLHKY